MYYGFKFIREISIGVNVFPASTTWDIGVTAISLIIAVEDAVNGINFI